MTRDRTHYTFLKWDEGLAVMLVDWCDVHHMKGSSRSGGLDQRKGDAHWWDKDFHQWEVGYEWKLETSDGRTATFTINNFEYDLSKGGAFRIDTGGDEVVVTQVDQDVSKIPLKKNACDHFLTSTSELTKPSKDANEDNQ